VAFSTLGFLLRRRAIAPGQARARAAPTSQTRGNPFATGTPQLTQIETFVLTDVLQVDNKTIQ
jgi:hypothetical protein